MTWCITINGSSTMELKAPIAGRSSVDASISDQVCGDLGRMDSQRFCAYWLWQLRPPRKFDNLRLDRDCIDLIQAAGGGEQGLVVEIIQTTGEAPGHWVIGKPGSRTDDLSEQVAWGTASTRVAQGEVFSAAEAGVVFLAYLDTKSAPGGYTRRAISP